MTSTSQLFVWGNTGIGFARYIVDGLKTHHQTAREIRTLQRLSDDHLQDLGLSRAEVETLNPGFSRNG